MFSTYKGGIFDSLHFIINIFQLTNKNLKKKFKVLFSPCIFLLSSIFYARKKYWNRDNFWLLVFNRFISIGMSWTRFFYFLQNACLFMWDTNFVFALVQKLLERIAWNFIYIRILTLAGPDYILVHLAFKLSLLFEIFNFFSTMVLGKTACKCI